MRSSRHLKLGVGITVAAIAGSLYPAASTFGAGGATGRAVQFFITPSLNGGGSRKIIVTGAIGDYGKGEKVNASGHPDPGGAYSLAELHYGTLLLNTKALGKAIASGSKRAHPDIASCSLHGSTSATMPILRGTGQYKGASGSVRAVFTFAEVAARYQSGPKKGKCNLAGGPVAQWASVVGTGKISVK